VHRHEVDLLGVEERNNKKIQEAKDVAVDETTLIWKNNLNILSEDLCEKHREELVQLEVDYQKVMHDRLHLAAIEADHLKETHEHEKQRLLDDAYDQQLHALKVAKDTWLLTYLLTHSPTYSLTHLLTHPLTYLLTHSGYLNKMSYLRN
jgi:hypothetical protein